MFHKISKIELLGGFLLKVVFEDGTCKSYDVSRLFDVIPAFNRLKEHPYEMEDVEVDTGGYGIIWSDELDLSSEELWENGTAL